MALHYSSSSSSEEEEPQEEEQEEAEDEEEQPLHQQYNVKPNPPKSQPELQSACSGTDSDSDSDHAPVQTQTATRSAALKRSDQTAPVQTQTAPVQTQTATDSDSDSDHAPVQTQTATRSAALKRSAAAEKLVVDETNSKRVKTRNTAQNKAKSASKNTSRVWSEADEIAILDKLVHFIVDEGKDLKTNFDHFHSIIVKSLPLVFTPTQLSDKVRGLKRKYLRNVGKAISNAHEQKAYDLSTKIWGNHDENGTIPAAAQEKIDFTVLPATTSKVWDGFDLVNKTIVAMGLDGTFVKVGFGLVDDVVRNELKDKWKTLHVAEAELILKRAQLISELAKHILDAYKGR